MEARTSIIAWALLSIGLTGSLWSAVIDGTLISDRPIKPVTEANVFNPTSEFFAVVKENQQPSRYQIEKE